MISAIRFPGQAFSVALFCLAIAAAGPGCRPASGPGANPASALKPIGNVAMKDAGPRAIDIGDVESSVSVEMSVAEESRNGRVTVNDEKSMRGKLTLCTVNIQEPRPDHLWLRIRVVAGIEFDYAKRPILVRGTILRDNQRLDAFSTVLGKHINTRGAILAGEVPPLEFKIDVLEKAAADLKSMLVHAEVVLQMLPEGAEETAPLASFPAPDGENTTTILSNPVRLNFAAGSNGA